MLKTKKSRMEWAVFIGLVCAVLLSFTRFSASCDELRSNVLRLHIIANSDSDVDQAVKLAVRERILAETSYLFEGQTELSAAEDIAKENLPRFCAVAERVLLEEGFSYEVSASVEDRFFNTREYEDFTLPAGTYRSLVVKLGEAKGKNWWCVVFPAVCVPAASDAKLTDSVSQKSAEIAENPTKYVLRFRAVEWVETLKKRLE